MNSKTSQLQVFPRELKFQNRARFVVLIVTMALLAITLSVKASYANPLSDLEAEASAAVCPADMVAYWKLDETSGTTFTNSVASNHATCTVDSCPLSVGGIVNSALYFDGVDDQLNAPDHDSLDWPFGGSFSVEVWINTTQACAGNKVFVGKHSGSASWWLGCSTNSGVVTFSLRDSNDITNLVQTTTSINDGNWHHVVSMRDGVNDKNMVYIDGVLVASETPTTPYTGSFSNSQPVTIGYHNSSSPGFYFDGILDEVAVYSRALTEVEITAHYNSGAGIAYCDALVAPTISPIPNQNTVVGQLFTFNVDASGSPEPTFTLTENPAGMTINANTGVIEWTPGSTGTFDVTVMAENTAGDDTENFTIEVAAAPTAPAIDPIPNQTATVNTPFTYTASATGNPTPVFSLPVKPGSMTINATTGVISWSPETAGTFNVTVRATNSEGFADASFTITVSDALAAPAISLIPDQNATVGTPFTYDVNATGNPTPTYSLVAPVPGGMTINATTGVINWTPGIDGMFNVTVHATNSQGFDNEDFTITVTEDYELFLPLVLR